MLRLITIVVFLVPLALSAGPASAQVGPHHSSPTSPVSIAVSGGLSAASRGNGAAAGLQLTFDLTDRLVLDGASFDLDRDRFFRRVSEEYPEGTRMIPITGMGGFGMMQGSYNGPTMWTGPWTGNTVSPDHMPAFYANRLGQMMVPGSGGWGMRSFNDPAISLGAGVRLEVSPRFFVRPDARALVVIANGSTYTVGVMTIGLGYRF
jgi:hypothetical protein